MKGHLWDDSPLLNAFDEAFLKQKRMHERGGHRGNSEEEAGKPSSDTEEHKPIGLLATIEEAGESSSLDYYTQLMNQYYQIHEQRQKILDQLHHQHTTTTSAVSHDVYSCCPAPPSSHCRADDIPKTGIDAVNRALSLLKSSQDCNSSSVKNNDKGSETELSSVCNAWYLAGYHTGKYLEEQDQLKRGGQ